jgi:hypothetical protein
MKIIKTLCLAVLLVGCNKPDIKLNEWPDIKLPAANTSYIQEYFTVLGQPTLIDENTQIITTFTVQHIVNFGIMQNPDIYIEGNKIKIRNFPWGYMGPFVLTPDKSLKNVNDARYTENDNPSIIIDPYMFRLEHGGGIDQIYIHHLGVQVYDRWCYEFILLNYEDRPDLDYQHMPSYTDAGGNYVLSVDYGTNQ